MTSVLMSWNFLIAALKARISVGQTTGVSGGAGVYLVCHTHR